MPAEHGMLRPTGGDPQQPYHPCLEEKTALIENTVDVPTKYGSMPSFTACPDDPGDFPAIIFYMDAPGFREELCNMARRIAKNGYFCIVPDMYYRLGTIRMDLPRRFEGMSKVIFAAMDHLTNADVVDDTAGLLAYIDAQDKTSPGPVGCVGYCMSGRYIVTVAAHFPTRIAAAASMYGVGIVTEEEDSPHLILDRIRGELYFSFAEVDAHVPEKDITGLKAALAKVDVKHALEIVPGTEHGYQFAERAVYAPVQAEAAWDKLFDLWARNLK